MTGIADVAGGTHGEYVASLYAALERGDVVALLDGLDADIEWVVPASLPWGGTFRGREAVLNDVLARFGTEWRELSINPTQL